LALFVLDAVAAVGLGGMLCGASAMTDAVGRQWPSMMGLAALRCARSARAMERACEVDVAYRVIATHHKRDHATIARFVERHERRWRGCPVRLLRLCAQTGVARSGSSRSMGPKRSTELLGTRLLIMVS
jgi:hypothetical protein